MLDGGDLICLFAAKSRELANRLLRNCPVRSSATKLNKKDRVSDLDYLAPEAGLEPATLRLTVECSTIELLRNDASLMRQTYGFSHRAGEPNKSSLPAALFP